MLREVGDMAHIGLLNGKFIFPDDFTTARIAGVFLKFDEPIDRQSLFQLLPPNAEAVLYDEDDMRGLNIDGVETNGK